MKKRKGGFRKRELPFTATGILATESKAGSGRKDQREGQYVGEGRGHGIFLGKTFFFCSA